MELKFDSIKELEQFLMFSAHIGAAFATQTRATGVAPEMAAPYVAPRTDVAEAVAVQKEDTEPSVPIAQGEDGPLIADGGATVEKPKRTRRTKAEVEAARAAEEHAGNVADGLSPAEPEATPTGANPFAIASPATQAILEAPNQSAATLAGIAAMQTGSIVEPTAAPRVIESIEHLRACQSFIQAHGMTKYNESFRDGLNANIAAYTPEQRSHHVAILKQLAA